MSDSGGEVDQGRGRLLSLQWGQVVLAVGVLGVLGALLVSSIAAVGVHERELQGLYSEEGDGTAMTFVQRESFGVVLELDDWARGDAVARDVQIARALLGQRLQVMTASGSSTFELTDQPYRDALIAVDEVVRSLDDLPRDQRLTLRSEADEVVDSFEVRTRELSVVFQTITRKNATEAIEGRAVVEQLQSTLAIVVVIMGVALAGWLAADLRVAYRRASRRLAAETRRLDVARRSLEFRRELHTLSRSWSEAVASGLPTSDIVAVAHQDLRQLMPEVAIATVDLPEGGVKFVYEPHSADVEADTMMAVERADLFAAIDRANENLHLAVTRDLRERRYQIERQHDPLTGLANREQLPSRVDDAIRRVRRRGRSSVVAVTLIDIDRFADFNNSFGHLEGDRLLIAVARLLRDRCPVEHAVLRLSADEFAVVAVFPSEKMAREGIQALAQELTFPYVVGDQSVAISMTVGAILSHSRNETAAALIQRAAAALAAAQASESRIPVRFFEWELDEKLMEVMHEESALRSALRSGEFVMHFQPIIELGTGNLAACEALVRWNRPGTGLIGPNEFLPAIARAGLTVELGWQIIDQSLAAWGAQRESTGTDLEGVRISINLDAAQLAVPQLADYIINAAQRHGVPGRCVVLEVTEHALLIGDTAIGQLSRLRKQGMLVALDDFGTGYSSLSQASSLPLDILKIDRSFLPTPTLDEQQLALIRDIISISTTLGLRVTAEGIENAAVASDLRHLGIDYGQGWHYARAMPIGAFGGWLEAWSATTITAG